MIINRRQFMQLVLAAATAAGLAPELARAEVDEVKFETVYPEWPPGEQIVIRGVNEPLEIIQIDVDAVSSRIEYDGDHFVREIPDWSSQLWTVRGRRGDIEEEYMFGVTDGQFVGRNRQEVIAFAQDKLTPEHLVERRFDPMTF